MKFISSGKTNPLLLLSLVVMVGGLLFPSKGESHDLSEYISTKELPAIIENKLTTAEKEWIRGHRKIRIAGPKDFPPFYFHDKDNHEQGIAADYTYMILKALGIEIDVQRNLPWPVVLERMKHNQVDLITLAAKTEERETYINFTQAYLSYPLVIISQQDAPFISGLNDLYDRNIACVRKVVTCEWLGKDLAIFHPIWVDTPLKGLQAVAYGEADVSIENLASASYLIRKNGLSNLKIAAPTTYGNYDLFIGVRKDWPVLISILNKSLSSITPAQQALIHNRWLSIRYEHGIQRSDVLKWVALVAGFLMLPFIIILVWNHRLKQEILIREKISIALQESEKKFSALFYNNPVPVSISSLETDCYKEVNNAVINLLGYSKEDMIGRTEQDLDIWLNREERNKLVEAVKRGGATYNTEYTLKTKSGELRNGLISGVKINLENHPYLLLVTLDITTRKQVEKKLKQAQERYTALFERSLDPIVIYDLEGKLMDANPAALDLLMADKETISERSFGDFLDQRQMADVLSQAQEIVKSGSQKRLKEYKLVRKDETAVWLETTASLIYEEGTPVAIQGLGRNITERKKAEKAQKRLISQLIDALDNIKTLKGMLPICANCKKIRDDSGYWNQIESYIEKHSDALFSHGICPDCAKELYGNEPWFKKSHQR